MNPERWNTLKELFGAALELDPGKRSAFLRDACGSDESLRAELESLLASYKRTATSEEKPSPSVGVVRSAFQGCFQER